MGSETRRISVRKVRAIIEKRAAACSAAVDLYDAKSRKAENAQQRDFYRQQAATERCALFELRHVLSLIDPEPIP